MLNCRELTELITDYLEGRLPLSRRLSFRFHVMMCRHCRAYLNQMRLTIRTLAKLPLGPIPPDVCDEMMHLFRNWQR
jgi:anti-sigma factor RsiW